jgi:hypothetical protein
MNMEPRNPQSRCATCQHLVSARNHHGLYCVGRDINIYNGYVRCKDYLCEPDKIPYKNGDWVIYRRPNNFNAFATQVGIIRDTRPKNHYWGVVIIEPQPRRSNVGYLDAQFWEVIIRTLTPKEIEQYKKDHQP